LEEMGYAPNQVIHIPIWEEMDPSNNEEGDIMGNLE